MGRKRTAHTFQNGIEGKTCGKCNEWKVLEDFYNVSNRAQRWDGKGYECKRCRKQAWNSLYGGKRAKRLAQSRKRFNEIYGKEE